MRAETVFADKEWLPLPKAAVAQLWGANQLATISSKFSSGAKAGLPDTSVDTQAAASFSAWQIIEATVTANKSLDDKKLADWLRANRVKTIQGTLRFNGPGNFGDDLSRIKQVQEGKWLVVYPHDWAAPGAKLRAS